MSRRREDYEVGYGRPPKRTQWKKGECGNPKRHHKRPPKGISETIEAALNQEIDILENGAPRGVSALEAILRQLLNKHMSGDRRAMTALLGYLEFFRDDNEGGEVVIEFVESD